mmetsp:Transcript_12969/g.21248  ORF Transcript_12969/g.21248 Transcript_12969/m.21248 type:complete len:93 (+) Transcript_12969:112-390(+)
MCRHPCSQPTLLRQECHMHHGIQNEECIREELTEKKCLAELHCQREATNFYPENEMVLPDIASISKEDREHCRKVVYDLARCLSKFGIGQSR